MDAEQIGVMIGTAVVTSAAALGIGQKVSKDAAQTQSDIITRLDQRVKTLESDNAALKISSERQIEKLEDRLKSLEDKVSTLVTTEEFTAYVDRSTESVNSLNEKVGRVTGAIEVWARSKNY